MRQAGTILDGADARRFVAYLITRGIGAQCEPDGAAWSVWVKDEDQIAIAKQELAAFREEPNHARYVDAEKRAAAQLVEQTRQIAQRGSNVVEMRGRWQTAARSAGPLTKTLIGVCLMVALLTDLDMKTTSVVTQTLMFADPMRVFREQITSAMSTPSNSQTEELRLTLDTHDPWREIWRGEVWRLITPAFLHGGLLHLLFNMMWLYQLGGAIERRQGSIRLAWMCLAIAIASNVAQAIAPAEWGGTIAFGGFSGVVYGLFGYAWSKSTTDPTDGLYISPATAAVMLAWLGLGFFAEASIELTGARMANWAHCVGLVAGMVLAVLPIGTRGR